MSFPISGYWLGASSYASRYDFSFLAQQDLNKAQAHSLCSRHLPSAVTRSIFAIQDQEIDIPFICLSDPRYPSLLKEIPHAPPVIFYKGNISLLYNPIIAIVGTRHCSNLARNFTHQMAKSLARSATIVSGLAYGLDQVAHLANPQNSIGVCGHGLSVKEGGYRRELYRRILESGGLLISEFHPMQKAHKWTFVQRNRTIAGLALALIVMEAPQRSGTLISAQNALNFNREVFVVPNHPLMIHALGGLELLDQGAHLALSAQQIKKDLNLKWIDPILSLLDRPHSTEELCS